MLYEVITRSRAEAELACWLAQPTQVGIPPTQLEVVDQREQTFRRCIDIDEIQHWPLLGEPLLGPRRYLDNRAPLIQRGEIQ